MDSGGNSVDNRRSFQFLIMDNGGNNQPSDGQQEKNEGLGVENGGNRKSTNS